MTIRTVALLLLSLTALLVLGCAGPQTLYPLPRQALDIETACKTCTRLAFVGTDHRRMLDLSGGPAIAYRYDTGATYADQRRLRIPILARVTGLEQTDRFTSPFDGQSYTVHGRLHDGKLTLELNNTAGNPLGKVDLTPDGGAAHGEISGSPLLLTTRGAWDAESIPPAGNAGAGWQHYPAGRLDTITLEDGTDIPIAAGQEVRHTHSMDYWRGPRWVMRLPNALPDADRNRLFLFYTAVSFARALNATYANIDDCLEDRDTAPHDGCPARLILR